MRCFALTFSTQACPSLINSRTWRKESQRQAQGWIVICEGSWEFMGALALWIGRQSKGLRYLVLQRLLRTSRQLSRFSGFSGCFDKFRYISDSSTSLSGTESANCILACQGRKDRKPAPRWRRCFAMFRMLSNNLQTSGLVG